MIPPGHRSTGIDNCSRLAACLDCRSVSMHARRG
jgi:hypothetical protein